MPISEYDTLGSDSEGDHHAATQEMMSFTHRMRGENHNFFWIKTNWYRDNELKTSFGFGSFGNFCFTFQAEPRAQHHLQRPPRTRAAWDANPTHLKGLNQSQGRSVNGTCAVAVVIRVTTMKLPSAYPMRQASTIGFTRPVGFPIWIARWRNRIERKGTSIEIGDWWSWIVKLFKLMFRLFFNGYGTYGLCL